MQKPSSLIETTLLVGGIPLFVCDNIDKPASDSQRELLNVFCHRFALNEANDDCNRVGDSQTASPLSLILEENGLVLLWSKDNAEHVHNNRKFEGTLLGSKSSRHKQNKPIRLAIDIPEFLSRQKSFPATRQSVFNQAVGRKTSQVIDATGGWGSDALQLCSQGYAVTIIERNPIMALLLNDAMVQLARSSWAVDNNLTVPQVIEGDAVQYLGDEPTFADCVYLDPMFPPKRKRSAIAPKEMQFLQWLLESDDNLSPLLDAALNAPHKRTVVKRPKHAEPIALADSGELVNDVEIQRYSSKLLHYDVYLKNRIA